MLRLLRTTSFRFTVIYVVLFAGAVALLACWIADRLLGLRVSVEDERVGLDLTSHGERAYGY